MQVKVTNITHPLHVPAGYHTCNLYSIGYDIIHVVYMHVVYVTCMSARSRAREKEGDREGTHISAPSSTQ